MEVLLYLFNSYSIVYSIEKIEKVEREGGRVEIIPCEHTVELLALELGNMGLSYPISEDDEEVIFEHFSHMDAEIGMVEDELIATKKYDEQVCRAVDEFNYESNEYIDYGELNRRLKIVLDEMNTGSFKPYVKIRWRKRGIDEQCQGDERDRLAKKIMHLSRHIPVVGYHDKDGHLVIPEEFAKDWEY